VTAVDPLLAETVERLLAKRCTFAAVERAETDGWCADVWGALDAAGLCRISLSEASGGSGGSLADAMAVLRAIGAHAAPVPVAEHALLGGWLFEQSGLELPAGIATVVGDIGALRVVDDRLVGRATVAWGRRAETITALVSHDDGWIVVGVRGGDVEIAPGANLAGEPRDHVHFDIALGSVASAPAPAALDGDALLLRGALTRVVMMAGAVGALSRLTVEYAHQRQQFGQAIARFQAVQQHLVTLAQSAVQLSIAADVAVRASAAGAESGAFEVAAAKIVADESARLGTRAAHQVHGAMGVTREYPLHHLSRRLWAWQHEYKRAAYWRRRLGAEVATAGADALFATVTR
jgi:acyl-CoA dehydrogenase